MCNQNQWQIKAYFSLVNGKSATCLWVWELMAQKMAHCLWGLGTTEPYKDLRT